ncbi:MAG TPA: FAD-dependent oxidoreductase, partial [Nitrososphaerales archaeon]|nr:FAD-dependent oxidoreductase [Nitrososphaerales archaeon]
MEEWDAVVVGAGIMGVASAYHILLNSPEKKVLLVDRHDGPGQGNTGRSNAMFRNTFSSRDNQTLADSSIEAYLHVQGDLGVDLGLQKLGYLWLMSEGQLSSSEPFLAGMEANRIEFSRRPAEELEVMLPGIVLDGDSGGQASLLGLPKVAGGIFGPKCGRLDPDKLVRYYEGEFIKRGGRVAYGTEAKQLMVGPKD